MKQETLEEVAENYANELPESYNYGINPDKKNAFINGAKWQQERMYSEEEVLAILDKFLTAMVKGEKTGLLEEWFKQFKKRNNE